jgi:HlyD family secretion protein
MALTLSFEPPSANLQFAVAWAFLCSMRRRKTFAFISGLALAAIFVAGCSSKSSTSFQGYIEGEYVYVAAPLGGALTNLAVARGDEVKAGQLLFGLERGSEAAAVQQAEQNHAQAQANLTLSEATFARRKQLRDGHLEVVSAEELDQSRALRDADRSHVDAQTAALDKARWAFDQKQQFAATNALVQDTLYRSGEWVAAGNPVVVLLPPANIKVRFFVPQAALPRIKPGQTVGVTFDGGQRAYSATVNYLSTRNEFTPPVLFNRENRAKLVYMVEAKFSPADAADLRPGQPVDVALEK